ncbi:demethylepipodophyllotoxin synthase-like [Salvia splendens]|nr:demethylepipodophyllotoxin synthase-like [Salvia splendens]
MELLLAPQWFVVVATVAITISSFYSFYPSKYGKKQNVAPHAGGGWPIIGHLLLLRGPEPLHLTLSKMADKNGPIFTVQLGTRRGLIVNSHEIAEECLKTNDVAFSNRQRTVAMALMGYNFAMFGFSNYGPYWREMRKIAVLRLLSNRKVAALAGSREVQVRAMNKQLYSSMPDVEMKRVLGDLTLSMMVRTVAGDVEARMGEEERERWKRSVRDFFKMMTVHTICDAVPWLGWMDRFGRMERALVDTGREFDSMLQGWLEEHKDTWSEAREDDDFMNEMLDVADTATQEFPHFDADTINKAMCLTMMVGGSETTAAVLTWALTLLLNNRHSLKKAQEELDIHVGRERLVNESDLENLAYIRAVIKETTRLQPPIPVIPREAGEDCVVAGYHIPAGTRLFINNWKIQRDPRVWADPLEFRPERFLTSHKDIDFQGLHFELLPFGGGRRVCPAVSSARRFAELALASFLQGFDVDTPSGEPIDMAAGFGTTNMVLAPIQVCIKPRLSPIHYA